MNEIASRALPSVFSEERGAAGYTMTGESSYAGRFTSSTSSSSVSSGEDESQEDSTACHSRDYGCCGHCNC